MERLDTQKPPANRGLEASIHLARYALALHLCDGRRVLDIACGEGYGASVMRAAGAVSVDAVDVSAAAIDKARATFGGDEALSFHCADVADLGGLSPETISIWPSRSRRSSTSPTRQPSCGPFVGR